jgi:CheB methylesterase
VVSSRPTEPPSDCATYVLSRSGKKRGFAVRWNEQVTLPGQNRCGAVRARWRCAWRWSSVEIKSRLSNSFEDSHRAPASLWVFALTDTRGLAKRLREANRLPVVEVHKSTALEGEHIYVLPKDRDITIDKDTLGRRTDR